MASQKVLLLLLIRSTFSRREFGSFRLSYGQSVLKMSMEYSCSKSQFTGAAGLTTASFEDCQSLSSYTGASTSVPGCVVWQKSTKQCHLFERQSVDNQLKAFRSKRAEKRLLTTCTARRNYQPSYALDDNQFLRYSVKFDLSLNYRLMVRTDNRCQQQGVYHYHQPSAALKFGSSIHFRNHPKAELSVLGVTQQQCEDVCKLVLGCNHWNFARFKNSHTGDCLLVSEKLEYCRSCTEKCPLRTYCANGSN